jgi:hypothetical protein
MTCAASPARNILRSRKRDACAAAADQRCRLSISTGMSARPSALRTSSVAQAVSMVSPTAVFFVPSGLMVENTARKPESPVMENRKNPSSSGWLT